MIDKNTIIPYEEIDEELRGCIKELNNIDGLETTCSCIGHNIKPAMISLRFSSYEILDKFVRNCLYSFTAWHLEVSLTDPNRDMNVLRFDLIGNNNELAFNTTIVEDLEKSCKEWRENNYENWYKKEKQ